MLCNPKVVSSSPAETPKTFIIKIKNKYFNGIIFFQNTVFGDISVYFILFCRKNSRLGAMATSWSHGMHSSIMVKSGTVGKGKTSGSRYCLSHISKQGRSPWKQH